MKVEVETEQKKLKTFGRDKTTDELSAWQVSHQCDISYKIFQTENVFSPDNLSLLCGNHCNPGKSFVVADEFIYDNYIDQIENYFDYHKVYHRIVRCPSGENQKSLDGFLRLAKELEDFEIHRRSNPIIAIGGGVITDLVSFLVSCYRRGVPHLRVPTTLMGYIDASIGIKTGINFNGNKNRLGSFTSPLAVILDHQFLKTLDDRHIRNGLAEVMKLAIIKDYKLFELLESHGKAAAESRFQVEGKEILRLSIAGMLEELEPNLFEDCLKREVDFGHTFSPLLEMRAIDTLLHGEAVAIDVAFSVALAHERQLLSKAERDRILDAMVDLRLPCRHPLLDPTLLWKSLCERVYHRDGHQNVPLPSGIGGCSFINDITPKELEQAFQIYNEITI